MRLRPTVPAIAVASAVAVLGGLLATTLLVQSQTGIDEDTHLEPSVGPVGGYASTMAPEDLPPGAPERRWPQIRTENDSPDFEGELLGIYLGNPSTMQNKDRIPDVKGWCPGGFETMADHTFAPPVPPYLPNRAQEPAIVEDAFFTENPNPGATVCRATAEPYTGWRLYELPSVGTYLDPGFRPTILLNSVREVEPFRSVDASADRVNVIDLAGSKVISVPPLVPEAGSPANRGEVIVPTHYGYLVIASQGVEFSEILKVTESLIPGLGLTTGAE
jgi:hypothetical protein